MSLFISRYEMKPHEIEASVSFYLRHLSICMDIIIPQKRVMALGA